MKLKKQICSLSLLVLLLMHFDGLYAIEIKTTITLYKKNKKLIHYHDFFDGNYDSFLHIAKTKSAHSDQNKYSRLLLIDLKSGDTVFNIPTIPVTALEFSNNGYIVGLTNFLFRSSPEIVVYDLTGKLVFEKNLLSTNVMCGKPMFAKLKRKYPEAIQILDSLGFVERIDTFVFLNVFRPEFLENLNYNYALRDSIALKCKVLSNVKGLVRIAAPGYIYWYSDVDPNPKVKKVDGVFYSLRVKSMKGRNFRFYPEGNN